MQLRPSCQCSSHVLLRQNLSRILGKLVLIQDIEDLSHSGYVRLVLGVNRWQVDVGEWGRAEGAVCDQPETSGEWVQRRGIHAGAVEVGELREGDSIRGRVQKLQGIEREG